MLFIFHSLFPLCPSVGPDAQWFHPLPPVPEAGRDLQPTQSTPGWDLFFLLFCKKRNQMLCRRRHPKDIQIFTSSLASPQ